MRYVCLFFFSVIISSRRITFAFTNLFYSNFLIPIVNVVAVLDEATLNVAACTLHSRLRRCLIPLAYNIVSSTPFYYHEIMVSPVAGCFIMVDQNQPKAIPSIARCGRELTIKLDKITWSVTYECAVLSRTTRFGTRWSSNAPWAGLTGLSWILSIILLSSSFAHIVFRNSFLMIHIFGWKTLEINQRQTSGTKEATTLPRESP